MSGRRNWKLAASTLGVVEEDLYTTVVMFQRHGIDASELRSAGGAFVHTGLTSSERLAVRDTFESAGIEIFAVASRVRIASAGDDDAVVAALKDEMRLAHDLGARFVRVFPGAPASQVPSDVLPQLEEDAGVANARAVSRLVRVIDHAHDLDVRPVLETHDSHPRGQDIARLIVALDEVQPGHPVGAIWDVLHPWRVAEPLLETADALMPHILEGRGYVQVKDVAHPGDTTPVLQGQGAVPLADFLGILANAGYDGPVSLEWERFWKPQVPALDDALEAVVKALR